MEILRHQNNIIPVCAFSENSSTRFERNIFLTYTFHILLISYLFVSGELMNDGHGDGDRNGDGHGDGDGDEY